MKKLLVVLALVAVVCWWQRGRIVGKIRWYKYYTERVKGFEAMPRTEGSIVFLGDSITDYVNFDEYLPSYHIINRGIAGDTTSGVLKRLGEVISLKPSKLFLLIGTNDIGDLIETAPIVRNIRKILERIHSGSPSTKLYVQAVLPTRQNPSRPNAEIQALNRSLEALAQALHCKFIDLYPLLLDSEGQLAEEYTVDGLHLSRAGNVRWLEYLVPYLDE